MITTYNGFVKPCPFCGREPAIQQDIRYPRPDCCAITAFEVICNTVWCPIYKADNTYFDTKAAAVDAWNTRAGEE